jgi:hypothetical protein
MSVIWGGADPEFVGVMPVRQDIEVLPGDETLIKANDNVFVTSKGIVTDKPLRVRKLKLGWTVKEVIGAAVVNPRGVSKGRKSVVIGE